MSIKRHAVFKIFLIPFPRELVLIDPPPRSAGGEIFKNMHPCLRDIWLAG